MAFTGLALTGCSASPRLPAEAIQYLRSSPAHAPVHLHLSGAEILSANAATLAPSLPPAVRAAVDAVLPQGAEILRCREWGPRGAGYRIEKRYDIDGVDHFRTALIAADGKVLERAHSVPIDKVPERVLLTAGQFGTHVSRIMIVSGPKREEYWQCTVANRGDQTFVVITELDGELRSTARRLQVTVDL